MKACARHGAAPGAPPRLELAEVLQTALARPSAAASCSAHHRKVLGALLACQTPALGGHLYRCLDCGVRHFIPHSCRNRHCPRCQKAQAMAWQQRQSASLLPVPYFHLVFTLPHLLNPFLRQNQALLYKLLFDCAAQTLLEFGARRFGAELGITAVLHTWGQTLSEHCHLHCIVTGGGLRPDGRWQASDSTYLFPVQALARVFRAKYCAGLAQFHAEGQLACQGQLAPLAAAEGFAQLLRSVCASGWVVYSKAPFGGPQAVLAYLSRYTHRVAIGSSRLLALERTSGTIRFAYKAYAAGGKLQTMTLDVAEFLRRFCLHILPSRFVKIRHYGLLGNRCRRTKIALALAALATAETPSAITETTPTPANPTAAEFVCPRCGSHRLQLIEHRLPAGRFPTPLDSS